MENVKTVTILYQVVLTAIGMQAHPNAAGDTKDINSKRITLLVLSQPVKDK